MLVVGLTGGMCCGKSAVSSMFAELGCYVIDADQVARKVVEPDAAGWKRIVKVFGTGILRRDKTIDRKKLAGIIFTDPAKRHLLNSITHPLIIKEEERIVKEIQQAGKHRIVIVSAALMIEAETYERFRKLILVYCAREIQIERIMKREKITRKEALQRIHSQLSNTEKRKYADFVINTSGPFPQTRKQVLQAYEKLVKLEQKRNGK